MQYQPVIGLEVHAELLTRSKMFCACPVVDSTQAEPNTAVCPVCAGMPGMLPVVNQQAVEYGLRVALALDCSIAHTSLFARKNYFYPDLPKGYQISQYEYPLAVNGHLVIDTEAGERTIRIRRVHLEEDTGKLTHVRTRAAMIIRWWTSTGPACRCWRSSPSRTCTRWKKCAPTPLALRAILRDAGGQLRRHGKRRHPL